jgi:hypothetical protein
MNRTALFLTPELRAGRQPAFRRKMIASSSYWRNKMAKVPTNAEVERAILDAIKTYNVRAGEIVPTMGVYMKVEKAIGAKMHEYETALTSMHQKGLIEGASAPAFLKLTDKGFAEM